MTELKLLPKPALSESDLAVAYDIATNGAEVTALKRWEKESAARRAAKREAGLFFDEYHDAFPSPRILLPAHR
jgi:hypothetical protein